MVIRESGVRRISIRVSEVDVDTVTLNVTIEGDDIDFARVKEIIEKSGGVIHSVDHVVAEK
jgi:hypothetical protein